jgi:hypothetical protein
VGGAKETSYPEGEVAIIMLKMSDISKTFNQGTGLEKPALEYGTRTIMMNEGPVDKLFRISQ